MRYFVNVNGHDIDLTLDEKPDGLWVQIGEKRHKVDYTEVDGLGQYGICVDNISYAASIDGELGKYTVGLAGDVYKVELKDEREKAADLLNRGPQTGRQVIEADMPGVIVKLLIDEGASVEAEQPLLILEAMKMQNEIRASAPGEIKTLHVKAGQTVSGGDKLVTIEGKE